MSAKAPAKGHTAKHAAASKSNAKHATSTAKSGTKHTPAKAKKPVTAKSKGQALVHATATHAKPAKPAGFATGDLLPVCSFEALAMSLRLAGQFVHDDEVVALWELAGAPALGASVAAALDTAGLHGLAGLRPQRVRLEWPGPVGSQDHLPLPFGQHEADALGPLGDLFAGDLHALILHVDVPGPHAVLATADGWWSWGELYSPWPCRIDEAWAVSWS